MRYYFNDTTLIPCGYCTGVVGSIPNLSGDVAMFEVDNLKIPMIKHLRDVHFPGLGLKHAKIIVEEMMDNPLVVSIANTHLDSLRRFVPD